MGEARFTVVLAEAAWSDLDEIDSYWIGRDDPQRGSKYFHDLHDISVTKLGDALTAKRGRPAQDCDLDGVQEILVFGVYRIIYEIDEGAARVNILRFWHAHRDTPSID